MNFEIGYVYHIEITEEFQKLYSFYRSEGIFGIINDITENHIYLKAFSIDDKNKIYYGSFWRIQKFVISKCEKLT